LIKWTIVDYQVPFAFTGKVEKIIFGSGIGKDEGKF
jgi:hypothetical protein